MNPLISELTQSVQPTYLTLPSRGVFYDAGVIHPDANPEEIEIHPLSMIDEVHFKDPVLLLSGKGLVKLINHVCPAILKPEELVGVDIDAILTACRLISYGQKMVVTNMCKNPAVHEESQEDGPQAGDPICTNEDRIEVDLQDFLVQRYSPIMDVSSYDLFIEETGQTVHLRPIPYSMEIEITKEMVRRNQIYEEMKDLPVVQYLDDPNYLSRYEDLLASDAELGFQSILTSIRGVTTRSGSTVVDRTTITEWFQFLTPPITNKIRDKMTEIAESFKDLPVVFYECSECGHVNKFGLKFDPNLLFFGVSEEPPTVKAGSSESFAKNETLPEPSSKASPKLPSRLKARSATKR